MLPEIIYQRIRHSNYNVAVGGRARRLIGMLCMYSLETRRRPLVGAGGQGGSDNSLSTPRNRFSVDPVQNWYIKHAQEAKTDSYNFPHGGE